MNASSVATIVLLEDNEDLLCSFESALELDRPSYIVKSFTEGKAAWEYLSTTKNPADVIILDHMVPGMSGFEIGKQLQKHTELKTIPIIMQSGKVGINNEEEAKNIGIFRYLTKPFSMRIFVETIDEAIKMHAEK